MTDDAEEIPPRPNDTEEARKRARSLIESIDWESLASKFEKNKWEYGRGEKSYFPSAQVLRRTAAGLFKSCLDHETKNPTWISGRFIVSIREGEPLLLCEALDKGAYEAEYKVQMENE